MDDNINFSAVYRPQKAFDTKPFDTSAVDYSAFSEMLTRILSMFDQGIVIAIDSPWGHGKSFFGMNFSAELKIAGWRTTMVDAFAHDYIEDPFLLLASTIIADVAPAKSKPDLLKAASAVGKALLPMAAKAVVRIGTLAAIDAEDLEKVGEAISDAGSEAAEKLIEKTLENFENERAGIEAFHKRLTALADSAQRDSNHPIVVFIDELDRCRPTFAIKTLERIKHFFDVPYLSFVLLLNREQLESSAKGLYGATLDAEAYLRKFIKLDLPLPQRQRARSGGEATVINFVDHLAGKISLGKYSEYSGPFVGAMRELAPALSLSMRDVEKAFTLFVSAIIGRSFSPRLVDLLAFVITLRVVAPNLYKGVIQKTEEGYTGVRELLNRAQRNGMRDTYAKAFMEVVTAHTKGDDKLGQDATLPRILSSVHLHPAAVFSFFTEMLDQISIR